MDKFFKNYYISISSNSNILDCAVSRKNPSDKTGL